MKIGVGCRQRYGQVVLGLQFLGAGNFRGIEALVAGIEEVADHAIKRLAIVLLEVVRAGIVIDMGTQGRFLAIELEDWSRSLEQRRQCMPRGETAIVLDVI